MTLRRVGILGGMGPEATVLLMRKVLEAVRAQDDADHIPLVVDQNPQVPSRIAFLIEGRGEDPGPILAGMARRLQEAGAEALAMPCNTAHHFAPSIRDVTTVPFLDMVEAATDQAALMVGNARCVGILASPAVRKIGLFDRAFAGRNVTPLYAANEDATLAAIRQIKSVGDLDQARAVLRATSQELHDRGAVVQMIACTEFSLIAEATAPGVKAFDTLDTLVGLITAFAQGA
ncbi:MAG: amino acid racemase [Paracoccaceae bacterium]